MIQFPFIHLPGNRGLLAKKDRSYTYRVIEAYSPRRTGHTPTG